MIPERFESDKTHSVTLEAFRDDETGELGLGVLGAIGSEGMNAASEGALIAHDLLEHVNGVDKIGPIADELEALGAIWYVRGQWNDLSRDGSGSMYSVYENIASDINRMFRDHVLGESIPAIPPQETDDDENLRCIVEAASPMGEIDDEEREEAESMLESYLESCLSYMQRGYAKACAIWADYPPATALDLFYAIADAVNPHAKAPEYEGARYSLEYGVDKHGNAFATCSEQYEYDEEECGQCEGTGCIEGGLGGDGEDEECPVCDGTGYIEAA